MRDRPTRRITKAVVAVLLTAAPLAVGVAATAGGTAPRAGGGCVTYVDNDRYPLRRCDKGDAVRWLQSALHVVEPSLAVDGHFGVRTEAALLEYEMTWGLPVDGIVDAHTWWSLMWWRVDGIVDADGSGQVDPWEISSPPPSPTPPPSPAPSPVRCTSYRADYAYPIQLCGRGEGVRWAQRGLRSVRPDLSADGYFGPRTHAALLDFQRAHGQVVTGEIDEATWVRLTDGLPVPGRDADGNGFVDPWEVGLR